MSPLGLGIGAITGAGAMTLMDQFRDKEKRRGLLANLLLGGLLGTGGWLGVNALSNYINKNQLQSAIAAGNAADYNRLMGK